MIFVDPRPVGNLERRSPHAWNQTFAANLSFHRSHPIREKCGIWSSVFAAGVLITLVNVEEPVSHGLQMLSQPVSVGKCASLVEAEIIGRSAPPSHRRGRRNPHVMEQSDQRTIHFQYRTVVAAN